MLIREFLVFAGEAFFGSLVCPRRDPRSAFGPSSRKFASDGSVVHNLADDELSSKNSLTLTSIPSSRITLQSLTFDILAPSSTAVQHDFHWATTLRLNIAQAM